MNILNSSAIARGFSKSQPDEVISLDHRLASPQAKDGVMPDPAFNLFYERLMAWTTASEPLTAGKIRRYLKDYIGADGLKDYGTLSKQQNILTQVLARMKEGDWSRA